MSPKRKTLPKGIELYNGRYRVRISFEGKQYNVGTFDAIGDAKAAQSIAQSEKARGIFVPPSQRRAERRIALEQAKQQEERDAKTVRDLAEAWLAWLERLGRSHGTIYTYHRHLESQFMPEFAARPVTSITADEITRWFDDLTESHGPSTANPIYTTVAAMFRYGAGESKGLPRQFVAWIEKSPADVPGVSKKSPNGSSKTNEPVATPEEIAAIAAEMPENERLGVLLAGWCGLRLGEVLGLTRKHISTTGPKDKRVTWIRIDQQVQARGSGPRLDPPKSKAGIRSVPVPARLVPDLKAHLRDHAAPGTDGLLFPRHHAGNEIHNPNTYRRHFNSARDTVAKRSKVQPSPIATMTFHGLRHSCLTRLGRAGATLADLMKYAGHSDVDSVLIYQHSERERLASLAESMSADVLTTEKGNDSK